MGSRNYLINDEDLSLSKKEDYKLSALAAGIERCAVKKVGDVYADVPGLQGIPENEKARRVQQIKSWISQGNFPESVDQRELVTGPLRTDLTAATTLDEMITAALAAVGTPYTCFQNLVSPQLLVNRLVVFYGLSIETAPIPISHLIFRKGGAAGNVVALFDTQPQNTRLAYDTFFSEPVVFDPQDVFAVQAVCRIITAPGCRLHLHNFLFGPAGQTLL
jgi:hypothetical protein